MVGGVRRPGYRYDIDGLRGIAVLAVIAHHLSRQGLPSGYLGVDVFFVISGFVITGTLLTRDHESLGVMLAGFYERRLKRLVPALIACVVVTGILVCLVNPAPQITLKTGAAALFGLANLFLLRNATDYFGASAELNAFSHTWSLGVEEQFYLLYPPFLWLVLRGRASRPRRIALVAALGLLGVTSLVAFIGFYVRSQPLAYFSMPTRLWELGAGCMVYVAWGADGTRRGRVWAGMLLGLLTLALFIPLRFAVPATVLVVCLTAALLATLTPGTLAHRLLSHPWLVRVGVISYSLYLWHWSVIVLSRWTIGVHWWSMPLQLGLMLVLATLSYDRLEYPLRHATWSRLRLRSIAYGLGASVAAAGVLVVLAKPLRGRLYVGRRPELAAVGVASVTMPYQLTADGSRWRGDACVLESEDDVGKLPGVEGCTLGSFAAAGQRMLALGSSWAPAFVQSFGELASRHDLAVTVVASFDASPVPQVPNHSPYPRANAHYWADVVPPLVARLRPGDVVFLVNELADFVPARPTTEDEERLRLLRVGLDSLSTALQARGISLAVLHALPFMKEANCQPAQAIHQWFGPGGGACSYHSRAETLGRRRPLDEVLNNLQQSGRISVVDPFDVFCPADSCGYLSRNGQLLYRDEWSHPSVEAALLSVPVIERALGLGAASPTQDEGDTGYR